MFQAPDYVVPVLVGTPAVEYQLTIDTGSTDMGIVLNSRFSYHLALL